MSATIRIGTVVKAVTQRGNKVKGKLVEIKKSTHGSIFWKLLTDEGNHVHVRPSTATRA